MPETRGPTVKVAACGKSAHNSSGLHESIHGRDIDIVQYRSWRAMDSPCCVLVGVLSCWQVMRVTPCRSAA
jgi:hypothetical protein